MPEAELLAAVVRKLVNDKNCDLNPGGYVVMDDNENDGMGTRCVDLTADEFAAVRRRSRCADLPPPGIVGGMGTRPEKRTVRRGDGGGERTVPSTGSGP